MIYVLGKHKLIPTRAVETRADMNFNVLQNQRAKLAYLV